MQCTDPAPELAAFVHLVADRADDWGMGDPAALARRPRLKVGLRGRRSCTEIPEDLADSLGHQTNAATD